MTEKINTDYLEFEFDGKKLFIMKDHPTALLCWKKAFDNKLINKDATLFHIDKHTDFTFDEKNKGKSQKLLNFSEEEIRNFIKDDLVRGHAEFIVNAMFSGLIKDGISIHSDECSDFGTKIDGTYSTTEKRQFISDDGIEHNFYLYETQNLDYLIGYQSLIGDNCIHQDTDKLFNKTMDLILDIDLDFFTYQNGGTYPKHAEDIRTQIMSSSFSTILNKSKIITIALEPKFCGNEKNSIEILSILNEYLFKNKGLDLIKAMNVKVER